MARVSEVPERDQVSQVLTAIDQFKRYGIRLSFRAAQETPYRTRGHGSKHGGESRRRGVLGGQGSYRRAGQDDIEADAADAG
jgi:hypothetical protein